MATKKETTETSSRGAAASKEEQVGFHKGSLSVLAKEREEMGRILGIVEQLMQMHIAALRELGVDLEKEAQLLGQASSAKGPTKPRNKPPIEDVI